MRHQALLARSTRVFNVSLVVVPLFMLAFAVNQQAWAAAGGDATAEVERVNGIWAKQEDSIKAIEVSGFKFVGSLPLDDYRLKRQDFETIVMKGLSSVIQGGGQDPDLDAFKALTSPLFLEALDEHRPNSPIGTWRPFKVVVESGVVRVDDGFPATGTVSVREAAGSEVRFEAQGNQASIYGTRSGLLLENIDTFLYHPKNIDVKKNWTLVRLDQAGRSRLESDFLAFDYESESGLIRRYIQRRSKDEVVFEQFQDGTIASTLGIPLPRLICSARYRRSADGQFDAVQSMKVYVIKSIQMNHAINPSVFKVAVPAGTRVVKFPQGDSHPSDSGKGPRPPIGQVTRPVSDVKDYSERPDFAEPHKHLEDETRKRSLTTMMTWIAAIGAAVVLFLGIWRFRASRV